MLVGFKTPTDPASKFFECDDGLSEFCRRATLLLQSHEVVISLWLERLFVARSECNLVPVSHLELKESGITD